MLKKNKDDNLDLTSIKRGVGSTKAAQQAIAEINWWRGKYEDQIRSIVPGKEFEDKEHPVWKRIAMFCHYSRDHYYTWIKQPPQRRWRDPSTYIGSFMTDADVAREGITSSTPGTFGPTTGILHWSAVSISFSMRGTNFPSASGHLAYIGHVIKGKLPSKNGSGESGEWRAFSLHKDKVAIQVGDVLIKPAGHNGTKGSHGDMVYKIAVDASDGKRYAHLCGGNITGGGPSRAGTWTEQCRIELDNDDIGVHTGYYLISLKKMS